jgi:hypothetical protein
VMRFMATNHQHKRFYEMQTVSSSIPHDFEKALLRTTATFPMVDNSARYRLACHKVEFFGHPCRRAQVK